MKDNEKQLKQTLRDEFDRVAEEEDDALQEDDYLVVPEGKKEELYQELQVKIRERILYNQLSPRDRKALELGRRMMEVENVPEEDEEELDWNKVDFTLDPEFLEELKAEGGVWEKFGEKFERRMEGDEEVEGETERGLKVGVGNRTGTENAVGQRLGEEVSTKREWESKIAAGAMSEKEQGFENKLDDELGDEATSESKTVLESELKTEAEQEIDYGQELKDGGERKKKILSVRKKKRVRVYVGLVAVLVAVFAVGMTSMGGAERLIRMMTRMIGDREITQVDSSEDNLVMVKEDEEKAYQRVSEKFGIEPVRIINKTEILKFVKMEFDEELQVAELFYEYDKESLLYLINASYSKTSWGLDIEDDIAKSVEKEISGCKIIIKEYDVAETQMKRYSASFKYKGLEYYLIGAMEEEKFYNILNSLFFYNNSR